jgi:hypothetical protein
MKMTYWYEKSLKEEIMSCHYIGAGLNTVTEKALELYDGGKIQFDDVKELLRSIKKAVNWCDGNEMEALECIEDCRCSRCLKETNKIFDLNNVKDGYISFDDLTRFYEGEGALTYYVCEDCYKELSEKFNETLKSE